MSIFTFVIFDVESLFFFFLAEIGFHIASIHVCVCWQIKQLDFYIMKNSLSSAVLNPSLNKREIKTLPSARSLHKMS